MRLRLDRYETAHRSMRTRTLVLLVVGALLAALAVTGTFTGIVVTFAEPNPFEDPFVLRFSAGIVIFFFGFVPALVSTIFFIVALRQRARFARFGQMAAIARQGSGLVTPEEVSRGLGTTVYVAHRIVLDARTLGILEDAPPLPPPPTPSPYAPTQLPTRATPNTPSAPRESSGVGPGVIVAGTYRIEEPLGRGGMGAVFAARHIRTGRRYALKTILAGAHANEATLRRFEREATAASAIGHPGIVQVHDFNVTPGGTFYLVMDLLEGETLADRIDRGGPLPWPDAQRIAIELASALGAAHRHGLLHRDVKPSNIFLARSNVGADRAVLVDFGLVKPLAESSALTSTGAVLGTPMYMSPEQARGEELDVRSDLYSLAAVVFEAVTGAPPFLDRTMAAVYARLLQEPPPRASQVSKRAIPPALDEVLARALAKDRTARFPDARAFGDALARIAEDAPNTKRMAN